MNPDNSLSWEEVKASIKKRQWTMV
jgi:hypothetical protein